METVKWGEMNVGTGVPLIEAGYYLVDIKDMEKTTAKTGTEQMLVKGNVSADDNNSGAQGAAVQDYLALTTNALWRVGAFVQAAGLDLKSLPNMTLGSEEFYRVLYSCKGRKMYWDIIQEANPKNGKIYNKVQGFAPYEDQEPLEFTDNVPSFIKNKGMQPPTAAQKSMAKKAGLI